MRISKSAAAKATEVYAGELFKAVSAAGAVDATDEALTSLARATRGSSQLRWALTEEAVPADTRRSILAELLASGTDDALVATVATMAELGHLELLGDVARRFGEIAESERGVVPVEVTTAVPLTDSLRDSIVAKLAADLGKGVSLRERVDPAILGGVVVNVAGKVLDSSVSAMLDSARLALSTAKSGGEA